MLRTILILLLVVVLVVIALVWTGILDVRTRGALRAPDIDVSATGGELPKVDVETRDVVIGTRNESVEVPVVETEERQIDVPVVGVEAEKE